MIKNRIPRNCLECGKPFTTVLSVIAKGKGKYCSRQCAGKVNARLPRSDKLKAQAKINVLKAHEARRGKSSWNKKDKIKLLCSYCNKEYEVHECEAKRSPNIHFCSRECSNKYKATITGTNHPLWTRQIRKCEWCGKEVWIKPAKLQEFRFCSRQCLGAWVKSNCQSPTKPELIVRDALTKLNIPFETEYRIGRYSCDFVLTSHHIVIEVDGDYWHSLPERIAKDKKRDLFLQEQGWKVFRFKEHDIYQNLTKCLVRISKHISLISF